MNRPGFLLTAAPGNAADRAMLAQLAATVPPEDCVQPHRGRLWVDVRCAAAVRAALRGDEVLDRGSRRVLGQAGQQLGLWEAA